MTRLHASPRHIAGCPGCGTPLALPAGRGRLQFQCPACGRQGDADTGAMEEPVTFRQAEAPTAAAANTPNAHDATWPVMLGSLAGAAAGVALAASGVLWSELGFGTMFVSLLVSGLLAMMLAGMTVVPLQARWETSRPRWANLCLAGMFCLLATAVAAPVYGWAMGGREGYDAPWRVLVNAAPESWQERLQAASNAHLVQGEQRPDVVTTPAADVAPATANAGQAGKEVVASVQASAMQITPKQPMPEFPQVAMDRGISGCCLAMARIGDGGVPVATAAACTDEVFEYAARRAMQNARFAAPSGSTRQTNLTFALEGRTTPACPQPSAISTASLSSTPSRPPPSAGSAVDAWVPER